MKKISYYKLGIAVIIIAAVLRLAFALTHTVSGDACWHLSAARFIAEENKMPLYEGIGRLQPFWAPPLFHLIAAFLYKLFIPISVDFADLAMKLVSPVFGTFSVIILFLIARDLFDEKIAFYSMLFVNFIPVFMDYSIFSFIESTVTFFSILSVYFMLKNMYIISSVSLGLAMLSKYNAVFVLPMLLFLAYRLGKNKKEKMGRLALVAFLPLLVSSVWFIRNWILLKNPVWPFLNGIFNGVNIGTTFNTMDLGHLFSLSTYFEVYLELFGVPGGDLGTLSFAAIPGVNYLIFIWLIGTLIFIYPLIGGFFSVQTEGRATKDFFRGIYILLISFLLMFVLYVVSLGWFNPRLLLPIIPFMAIIWALGLNSIKIQKVYLIAVILVSFGFIGAQAVKLSVASNEWGKYDADFQWVKDNTKEDSLFFGNGQCLSYNINRLVIDQKADIDLKEADYVWVNNAWKIDFTRSKKELDKIDDSNILEVAYNNENTGTVVYKVR